MAASESASESAGRSAGYLSAGICDAVALCFGDTVTLADILAGGFAAYCYPAIPW